MGGFQSQARLHHATSAPVTLGSRTCRMLMPGGLKYDCIKGSSAKLHCIKPQLRPTPQDLGSVEVLRRYGLAARGKFASTVSSAGSTLSSLECPRRPGSTQGK